jgi:predicted DNA-binding transcriptional regulator YafY
LRIPYREARELVMDVLRHGAGVEVSAPAELRRKVMDEILRVAALYK